MNDNLMMEKTTTRKRYIPLKFIFRHHAYSCI